MRSNPHNKHIATHAWRVLTLSLFTASTIIYSTNLSALAYPITYTAPSANQNASFIGEIPIKQIGSIALPKAVVQFKDTDINILAVPDWLFDRSNVLSGALVNIQVELQGNTNTLTGLAYFLEGLWIANLGSPNAIDVIDTISGEQLRGRIRARLDEGFAFKPENGPMRKLLLKEIKNIKSPRAYTFSIYTEPGKLIPLSDSLQFNVSNISFVPTFGRDFIAKNAKVPESHLAGTEPGITKTQIAAMVGMNMTVDLAPAIVIPLVLNKGNETAALHQIQVFNAKLGH